MGNELWPWLTPELGNWIGGLLTLCILSLVYKENPFYRYAEHIYIGSAVAQGILITWNGNLKPRITNEIMTQGQYWMIIPICMGLLIYFNLVKGSHNWLVRIPMSYWIGYNAALSLSVRTVNPFFVNIVNNMRPLIVMREGAFSIGGSLTNLIFVTSVLCTIVVFFFTFELKGAFVPMAKVGRYAIMLGMGASFGNTVSSRYAMLIGRWTFILRDWLGII